MMLIRVTITSLLILLWFVCCGLLSLLGVFLPVQKQFLTPQQARGPKTICRILYEKGLLSVKEYEFEVNQVAPQYSFLTFRGYFFIMKPVLVLLDNFHFFDSFVLYFVKRWMKVHKSMKLNDEKIYSFDRLIAKLSTSISEKLGQLLYSLNIVLISKEDGDGH